MASAREIVLPPPLTAPDGKQLKTTLVCSSPIEMQYYGTTLVRFPPICYHCGIGEESLVNNDSIEELKKQYTIVSPICFLCYSEGKKPSCRLPLNKRRRLS